MREIDIDTINNEHHKNEHYKSRNEIEAIDVIEGFMTEDQFIGYCKGTIMAYSMRLGRKGEISDHINDCEKIIDYVKWLKKVLMC